MHIVHRSRYKLMIPSATRGTETSKRLHTSQSLSASLMYGFVGGPVINQAPQTSPFAIHKNLLRKRTVVGLTRLGFKLDPWRIERQQRARRLSCVSQFEILVACE